MKQSYPCKAYEMYAPSSLFSKQYEYAKSCCDKVFIMSAKYGLLDVDSLIEPYDITLNDFSSSEISVWASNVYSELKRKTDVVHDTYYFFAGKNYYSDLIRYLPNYRLPLQGLKFGERLSKLDGLLIKRSQSNTGNQTICDKLHELFLSLPRYNWETISNIKFTNGIYIVFEKGEVYKGKERIVRVGTHKSDGRLKERLRDHFLKENKDGSIFRKNIGKAMLNRDGDAYLQIWSLDTSKIENQSFVDWDKQKQIEKRVSEYMRRAFSIVVFQVDSKDERLRFEEGIISSLNYEPTFIASPKWNGHYSTEFEIRESGMWLKQGLNGQVLTDDDFEVIENLCSGINNVISNEFNTVHANYKRANKAASGFKYQKLLDYFMKQGTTRLELSFSEIENILDFQLPNSAYRYPAWWANGGHVQAYAWLNAGWKVGNIKLGKSVLFVKET
jgi:hypothetical protein